MNGRLAQLVQSICLTSRGSAVRIRQRPPLLHRKKIEARISSLAMELNLLTAISPVDGRYRKKTETLAGYFSEFALIRYRVRVEIEYFITLCELPLPQLASFPQNLFVAILDLPHRISITPVYP